MKKVCLLVVLLLACAAVPGYAQDFGMSRIGVHSAYSSGGDVEDAQFGFGAQAEFAFTPNVSIELSVSQFSDEYEESGIKEDLDVTTIGLSALFRAPLGRKAGIYFLGGLDYNIADLDISLDRAVWGPTMNASADVDDEFGFHLGAGINLLLHKNVELFAEFRYTFLALDADLSVTSGAYGDSARVEGDYDFGLFKIGINYKF